MSDFIQPAFVYATYPDLNGKRVVITGGGSGIGAELVSAFVGQGARVWFLDIAEAEPERCRIIDADLGLDAVEAAIRAAVAAWRPDLLSAAAGEGHDHAA